MDTTTNLTEEDIAKIITLKGKHRGLTEKTITDLYLANKTQQRQQEIGEMIFPMLASIGEQFQEIKGKLLPS